jgi:hypothetical protein
MTYYSVISYLPRQVVLEMGLEAILLLGHRNNLDADAFIVYAVLF